MSLPSHDMKPLVMFQQVVVLRLPQPKIQLRRLAC